jgi:hypothetical protein
MVATTAFDSVTLSPKLSRFWHTDIYAKPLLTIHRTSVSKVLATLLIHPLISSSDAAVTVAILTTASHSLSFRILKPIGLYCHNHGPSQHHVIASLYSSSDKATVTNTSTTYHIPSEVGTFGQSTLT